MTDVNLAIEQLEYLLTEAENNGFEWYGNKEQMKERLVKRYIDTDGTLRYLIRITTEEDEFHYPFAVLFTDTDHDGFIDCVFKDYEQVELETGDVGDGIVNAPARFYYPQEALEIRGETDRIKYLYEKRKHAALK